MSSVIPREQVQGFQRWELASFDQPVSPLARQESTLLTAEAPAEPPAPEPIEAPEPPLVLPTAEDIERVHTEAHAEGFRQGHDEGLEAGKAEGLAAMQEEAGQVSRMTAHLADSLKQLDQDIAEDVLALALEVARQIVGASLQVNRDGLLPVIREATAALPLHHGTVMVHIHPEDAELVRRHFGEQLTHAGWRVIEDREVQPGGCRLLAGSSEVDATVGTRWRRILEAIGAKPEWLEPGP